MLLGALLGGLAQPVWAQDPTILPAPDKAPVVLDGRVLFEVGEAGTWSARQRAQDVNRVLRAAAVDPEPVNLTLAAHEGFPTIRMGDWHLLTVMDSDVLPGMDSGEQAQRWMQTVEAALLEARTERTGAYAIGAVGRIAALAALAAALHWLLWWTRRRLPIRLGQWQKLSMRSPLGGKPGWQIGIELICWLLQALVWTAVALYALAQFPATRQTSFDATRVVEDSLRAPLFTANARNYSADDLLWLLGAIVLLWIVVGGVTRLLSVRLMRATGAQHGALQPVATLVRYALTFVGLIVILQIAGINLSTLAILASVLGVGIGFGLQNIANNFVSGAIMSFEQPIKPGDFVSIGDMQGTVQHIGARATIIRTLDRVSVIVPNARLLEHEVVNWSYGDELARLQLSVGVAYGSDIERVRSALLDAAKSHPAVLADPRPEVRLVGFGDNALDFKLLVWSKDPAGQALLTSDLMYRIEANLRRACVDVPFPQRTLHLSAAALDAIAEHLHGPRPAHGVALYDASGAPAAVQRDAPRSALPLPADDGAPAPSPVRPVELEELIARMRARDGLHIADRRYRLARYARCFVGSEAVEWLMREQDLTREQSIRFGQMLVERGIIHHVLDEHPFLDGNYFYRFYADEGS